MATNCFYFCRGPVGSYLDVDLKPVRRAELHTLSNNTGVRGTNYGPPLEPHPFSFEAKRVNFTLAETLQIVRQPTHYCVTQQREKTEHIVTLRRLQWTNLSPLTGRPTHRMIRIILSFSAQFAHFPAHSARGGRAHSWLACVLGGRPTCMARKSLPPGPGEWPRCRCLGAKNARGAAEEMGG